MGKRSDSPQPADAAVARKARCCGHQGGAFSGACEVEQKDGRPAEYRNRPVGAVQRAVEDLCGTATGPGKHRAAFVDSEPVKAADLDTAKAIAVFSGLPGAIRDYRAPHDEGQPGLPIIAIPTTLGYPGTVPACVSLNVVA